jgi:hypothetical protein
MVYTEGSHSPSLRDSNYLKKRIGVNAGQIHQLTEENTNLKKSLERQRDSYYAGAPVVKNSKKRALTAKIDKNFFALEQDKLSVLQK